MIKSHFRVCAVFLSVLLTLSICACNQKPESENTLFEGKTLGAQSGTAAESAAKVYIESGAIVESYGSFSDCLAALLGERIDYAVTDEWTALEAAEANDRIEVFGKTSYHADFCAVIYDNPELLSALNGAFFDMKEDGTIESILEARREGKSFSDFTVPGSDKEIVLATDAIYKPYSYADEDGNICGAEIDIAKEAAARLGLHLTVKEMEFDRIFVAISEGKADFAMSGITVTPERSEAFLFTESYLTVYETILVKK